MEKIAIHTAYGFVARTLDELSNTGEIDLGENIDDIEKLVEASIEEAAVRIHQSAPSYLMEGKAGEMGSDYQAYITNSVLYLGMEAETVRVVRIKVGDSDQVVTEFVPEDSPEGRMQLDSYARGVPDDPVVVLQKKWEGDNKPAFKYYTTALAKVEEGSVELEYVPYPKVVVDEIEICPRLKYAVLNELAAMVMESLSLFDKATIYRTKAQEAMK